MNTPRLRFKDLGEINYPEWEWKKIEDCCLLIKDGTHGTHKDVIAGIPLLSAKDIYENSVHVPFDARKISEHDYKKIYSKYELKKEDVLITIVGTLGRTAIIDSNTPRIAFQRSVAVMRPSTQLITAKYLNYVCNSHNFQNEIEIRKKKGAQPGIYLGELSSISIPVPSLPEQQKIADFLSSYDEKISIQRERVEALERRKKGLLQKVFSKEIRFKADNGTEYPEWSNSTFSSVFTSVGNNTFSRSDLTSDNSSNIRNIHYGDVLIKYGEIINTEVDSIPYIKKNISLSNNNDKLLQNGDIVFADTAEDNTVGKACEIALSDFRDKIVSGLHTIAVRPTIQFASGYLGYFLNSSLFHDQLLPLIQGIKVSSISKKALFEETRVYYPSYQEQQKISDLFTIISEQIKVERERLSTMETIKKSLLQGLFC